jgi:hypothetical protein
MWCFDPHNFNLGNKLSLHSVATTRHYEPQELDPVAYIERLLKKNPDAFNSFDIGDLRLFRKTLGRNLDDLDKLIEQVRIIVHIDHISMPLTWDGFKKICKSLKR